MRLVPLLGVIGFLAVATSCASEAATECVALTAAGTETSTASLAQVTTDRSGARTIRTAEGVQVRHVSGGDLEITGVDGKKIVVASDGNVRSAQRDVLLVRADGSRTVWDLVSQTLLTEDTWTEQRAGGAGGGSAARTASATSATTTTTTQEQQQQTQAQTQEQEQEAAKDVICHVPPGNPGNQHTLSVGSSAVSAHLKHGDYEGACDPARATAKEHGKSDSNGKSKKK